MSNDLVPGCNIYLGFGWIWDMPDPNPHILEHSHDYDEVVLHIGSDLNNPEDLGGKIEFVVGGEPVIIDKTSALYIPKGVKHGPVIWKRVDRPHIQMAIVLGAGTLAESAPGGTAVGERTAGRLVILGKRRIIGNGGNEIRGIYHH